MWDAEADATMARLRSENISGEMPGELAIEMQPGDAALFHVKAMHRGTYELGWTRRTIAVSFCVADQADMPTAESLVQRNGYDHVYQPWFLQEGYLDGCTPGSRRFWERFCAVYSGSWPREYCDGLEDELRGYFWPPSAAPLPRL